VSSGATRLASAARREVAQRAARRRRKPEVAGSIPAFPTVGSTPSGKSSDALRKGVSARPTLDTQALGDPVYSTTIPRWEEMC
jgi:hypothetical protein